MVGLQRRKTEFGLLISSRYFFTENFMFCFRFSIKLNLTYQKFFPTFKRSVTQNGDKIHLQSQIFV